MSVGGATMRWRVDVAKLGEWPEVPGPELYWMSAWGAVEPLFLLTVIGRADDGSVVVVNTGPPADYLPFMNETWRRLLGESSQLRVEPSEDIEAILGRLGIKAAEVTHVVCTPFQAYSVGNVDRFPNARICLSRRGWHFFFDNPYPNHPHDIARMMFPPRIMEHLIYEARDRIRLLDDEDTLAPGLSTFFTGVHHRASIAVRFETAAGTVIASDSAFRYRNVEAGEILGINENMYEALDAYARFRREADILIPLYEDEVFERHPGGRVA
jgi:glyoxylase-like metal-dependent hydrolase (beta-lactamase superfamily II)